MLFKQWQYCVIVGFVGALTGTSLSSSASLGVCSEKVLASSKTPDQSAIDPRNELITEKLERSSKSKQNIQQNAKQRKLVQFNPPNRGAAGLMLRVRLIPFVPAEGIDSDTGSSLSSSSVFNTESPLLLIFNTDSNIRYTGWESEVGDMSLQRDRRNLWNWVFRQKLSAERRELVIRK